MSTVPPPPGQPPYGSPYQDPRTQYRAYRDQQKAAWRAQRDAWKAQRYAYKAQYRAQRVPSIVGPVVLVTIGVIGLLVMTGHVHAMDFWRWYGQWWPLILIAAGLGLLAEWFIDLRRGTPVRRSGGFVGLLIFLCFIGIMAGLTASANDHWNDFRSNWGENFGSDGDDFFNSLGRPQHEQDQQVLNTTVPANATIQITNPRGSVSITAGDAPQVQVLAHQVAYADSDTEAQKIFDGEKASVRVSGGAVVVETAGNSNGRVNLTVTVPKTAAVAVQSERGDVTASGLGNGTTITAAHGDVHLSEIHGSVQVHFSADKGDFSAHDVTGDITADGRCNDVTLSEIKGKVALNGNIFGDVHMENLSGGVHLHTSVSDVQFGDLPGDLTLNDEDLHITEATGGVRVTTHSKNVDLAETSGDIYVDDRDGDITLAPKGNASIDAHNTSGHGDVVLTLPSNASATVDARTRNGDIVSDYPLPSNGDYGDSDSKQAKLVIAGGQAKVSLSTDVGDVHIKRGSSSASDLTEPSKPPAPPKAPRAPRLKSTAPPAESVTQ